MVNGAQGSKGALWRVGLAACLRDPLNVSALAGVLHDMKPPGSVSPACRASSAAIPPIGGGVAAKLQTH